MALIDKIKLSFSDRPIPTGKLFESEYVDNADKILFNKSWSELSAEEIELHSDVLYFLTDDAFCYYLPAFLVSALKRPETYPAQILIQKLVPPKHDINRPSFRNWWSMLTVPEKEIIIQFLSIFMHDDSFGDLKTAVDVLKKSI